jgi:hypothetical protein
MSVDIENIIQSVGGVGVAFGLVLFIFSALAFTLRTRGGWGPYNIQALGLTMLIPSVVVLGATNALPTEVTAAVIGALVGFIVRGSDNRQ